MSLKKFIVTIAIKVFAFGIISAIALTLFQTPLITNELALGQMENSDSLFMLMDGYYKIRPWITGIYSFITVLFIGHIGISIFNFIKKLKEEKEKN